MLFFHSLISRCRIIPSFSIVQFFFKFPNFTLNKSFKIHLRESFQGKKKKKKEMTDIPYSESMISCFEGRPVALILSHKETSGVQRHELHSDLVSLKLFLERARLFVAWKRALYAITRGNAQDMREIGEESATRPRNELG